MFETMTGELFHLPPVPPVWGNVIGTNTVGACCIPPYSPTLYKACRLSALRHTLQWLPAASTSTPSSTISLSHTAPLPLRPTPIPLCFPSVPESPQYILKYYGEKLPGHPSSCP